MTTTPGRRHDSSAAASCAWLRVVLLVSGPGGDATHYKPDRDETQWWSRRDALVRMVAAFLFGPSETRRRQQRQRELTLLFDQDLACIHMMYNDDLPRKTNDSTAEPVIPTERTLVSLWKQAALSKDETAVVSQGGLVCCLVRQSPAAGDNPQSTITKNNNNSSNSKPNQSNKRELLHLLQNQCSMDFLRQHNLNASSSVALRKVNRTQLLRIWYQWQKTCSTAQQQKHNNKKNQVAGSSNDDHNEKKKAQKEKDDALQKVFEQLLFAPPLCMQPPPQEGTPSKTRHSFLAATLHESSMSELPYWNPYQPTQQDTTTLHRHPSASSSSCCVCLFLGGVRDMTRVETTNLRTVCQRHEIAVVPVRLGPVAEFTSKILTLVAFHESQGMLGPALQTLVIQQQQQQQQPTNASTTKRKRVRPETTQLVAQDASDGSRPLSSHTTITSPLGGQVLHVILLVPLDSSQVTTDLESRSRLLWSLVRCIVTGLWRSRLVATQSSPTTLASDDLVEPSKSGAAMLQVKLTLVFHDKVVLTLDQKSLVQSMAEKHQAAPSEYQILNVLQERLAAPSSKRCTKTPSASPAIQTMETLIHDIEKTSKSSQCFVLDLIHSHNLDDNDANGKVQRPCFSDYFYSKDNMEKDASSSLSSYSVLALIALNGDQDSSALSSSKSSSSSWTCSIQTSIWEACQRVHIPMLPCAIVPSSPATPHPLGLDHAAATITLLQHFAYQNRLLGFCRECQSLQQHPLQQQKPGLPCGESGDRDIHKSDETAKKKAKRKKRKKQKTT